MRIKLLQRVWETEAICPLKIKFSDFDDEQTLILHKAAVTDMDDEINGLYLQDYFANCDNRCLPSSTKHIGGLNAELVRSCLQSALEKGYVDLDQIIHRSIKEQADIRLDEPYCFKYEGYLHPISTVGLFGEDELPSFDEL